MACHPVRHEQLVQSVVVGEFRVERCHRTASALHENRYAVVRGQDLDVVADALDERGPDEDGMKRLPDNALVAITLMKRRTARASR